MSANRHYHKKERPPKDCNSAALLTEITYQYHYQNLLELALSRRKWVGLPPTCDVRWFNECVTLSGVGIIAKDPDIDNLWYSGQVALEGDISIYNNPTKYTFIGANGKTITVPRENGYVVWDNVSRLPILQHIQLFAHRLTNIDRTRDINLSMQRKPKIMTGPEEKYRDMINLVKEIDEYQDTVLGLSSLSDVDIKAIDMQVPYIGTELDYNKRTIMNEYLTFLGISNPGFEKNERMTADEVQNDGSQVMIRRLSFLDAPRQGLELLNKERGFDAKCLWNYDNVTDNYDYHHNIIMREGNGNGKRETGTIANGERASEPQT